MKKIINGKKYDTDTANLVGCNDWGGSVTDFNYFEETLYVKRTGEFFLHGTGNAASKYSESLDSGGSCEGEAFYPLSQEAAKEWCEQHLDTEGYEKLFGEVEE